MPATLSPEAFLTELDALVQTALSRIGEASAAHPPADGISIAKLLEIALKNELEASEEAALWMTTERDVHVKLALARQCGDEAKHYRLIEERLRALGVDTASIDPTKSGATPMFTFLAGLETTVERIAAGQLTREALAGVRNRVFADHCEAQGDHETARLYRDVIQPDEAHHHALGRKLRARFAIDETTQAKARAAAMRTVELAEELQELARLKRGVGRAPGC